MNNKHVKIDSGDVLKTFLKNVVNESVKGAKKLISEKGVFKDDPEEKEQSLPPTGKAKPPPVKSKEQFSSSTPPADPTSKPAATEPSSPVSDVPNAAQTKEEKPEKRTRGPNDVKAYIDRQLKSMQGTLTVDKVIDRLNTIRSGKSLKDEIVSTEMEKYFNDLSTTEREALNTFLLGITFIVNPPNDAGMAPDPGDKNIHMTIDKPDKRPQGQETTSQKKAAPSVSPRRPSPAPRASSAGSIENTDAPVQVKKNVP